MAQRSRKLEHALELQRHRESKAEQTEELISRYREPLLLAANSLQSRLHNGINGDYLHNYLYCGDPEEERYARNFTVYTVAEYLCWVEIIRRELRFLDLGDEARTRTFNGHLETISHLFGTTDFLHPHFRIFRGKQRAIGQLMMVSGPNGTDLMPYPEFDSRLVADPEFARWFNQLRKDVDAFLTHDWVGNTRLVQMQWALIDLIDFLDPGSIRLTNNRARLTESDRANRITPVPR
ncbi:MAG TPA: hypothetical protein DGG94_21980 [Micromonosporaceae bacterium]|nr:hypothetical protein [Micromonosporaceae bacterium]HCU52428.1 hypothetical protein [Micromonosporaceae bacterium]